jgi:hypothetical protein
MNFAVDPSDSPRMPIEIVIGKRRNPDVDPDIHTWCHNVNGDIGCPPPTVLHMNPMAIMVRNPSPGLIGDPHILLVIGRPTPNGEGSPGHIHPSRCPAPDVTVSVIDSLPTSVFLEDMSICLKGLW